MAWAGIFEHQQHRGWSQESPESIAQAARSACPRSLARARYSVPRVIGDSTPDLVRAAMKVQEGARKSLEDVVLVTRLFKPGSYRPVAMAVFDRAFGYFGSSLLTGPLVPFQAPCRSTSIEEGDRDGLVSLWRVYQAAVASKHGRALDRAVRQFVSSLDRQTLADRIVDLAIAGEAALLFSNDNDSSSRTELGYRLALRAAALESGPARLDVYREVKAFYSLRSAIVHGGEPSGKRKAEASARSFEARLRSMLHALLGLAAEHRCAPDWERMVLLGSTALQEES
jgi:hypothetical protein